MEAEKFLPPIPSELIMPLAANSVLRGGAGRVCGVGLVWSGSGEWERWQERRYSAAPDCCSKHRSGGLSIGGTLYRKLSLPFLFFGAFTELQHSDTDLAGPIVCVKLYLGND
jgi:hypothetical protein